jgi:hypothetical protein
MQKGRQMEMTKLIAAFGNFAMVTRNELWTNISNPELTNAKQVDHYLGYLVRWILLKKEVNGNVRNSSSFMEREDTLPISQEPSTGIYSEADKLRPLSLISLIFILIISFHLKLYNS